VTHFDVSGEINMESPGIGVSPHVAGELFDGVDMVHVPGHRCRPPCLADRCKSCSAARP
jgi:hypothetical protein